MQNLVPYPLYRYRYVQDLHLFIIIIINSVARMEELSGNYAKKRGEYVEMK